MAQAPNGKCLRFEEVSVIDLAKAIFSDRIGDGPHICAPESSLSSWRFVEERVSALDEDQLWLTFYDETGNVKLKELFIEFSDIYASEAGSTFAPQDSQGTSRRRSSTRPALQGAKAQDINYAVIKRLIRFSRKKSERP